MRVRIDEARTYDLSAGVDGGRSSAAGIAYGRDAAVLDPEGGRKALAA